MTLLDEMARKLTPTTDEEAEMTGRVARLEAACNARLAALGVPGQATVQGSIAKGTWIAGSTDLDLFLLLEPSVPTERLEALTTEVAAGVLEGASRKYAQHPYLIGTFEGADVDLVPAYAVASASDKMSAVDRTPFHTAWVAANLDAAMRTEVRLAKQWCKGVGIYGAETAIAGFSGYLIEVLIAHAGGFMPFLAWLKSGAPGPVAHGENRVEDSVSPLIVVDPVDAARNCAAAVAIETIERAQEAAAAFLDSPAEAFFFPAAPRAESAETLTAHQSQAGEVWCGLTMTAATDRLDIVFPQFQKAGRAYVAELERMGFPVHRHRVHTRGQDILMEFVTESVEIPATRTHVGPRADKQPNANKYRKKWEGHPDAASAIEEVDGFLQLELHVRERDPATGLAAAIAKTHTGKHVKAALKTHQIWAAPGALDAWGPEIADTVLDRRPWQR